MDENRPGYYAVIPADVRYDDRIPANAKLLYGEISALIGSEGYCFASNQYFADIYGCTPVTVARLITSLEKNGYIKRELEKDNTGQVIRRKIYLSASLAGAHPLNNFDNTPQQNCGEGIIKNDKDTNLNITNIDIKENKKEKSGKKKDAPPKTDFDPLALFAKWIMEVFNEKENRKAMRELYKAVVRFCENRVALKKPMKSKGAVTALCNKLMKLSGGDLGQMIELLDNATVNGWQSVFPLKGGPSNSPPPVSGRDKEWL